MAKTASDHAGRLLALIVMARYTKEEAVAQSNRSFSPLNVGRSLPCSEEVLDLVDELAAERLADHLTADVREQRAAQRAQDAERREHKQAIEERTGRLEELTAEQRDGLLAEASSVLGPYSPQTFELRRRIEALEHRRRRADRRARRRRGTGRRGMTASATPTIHQMEEQPLKVTLTESELAGDYIVAERAPDGSVQLVPDTSLEGIQKRIGGRPMTPDEFSGHFGGLPRDDEG